MMAFRRFWNGDKRHSARLESNRRRRLGFEALEERRMLDGDPPFELIFADTSLDAEIITEPLPGDFRPELAPPLPMTADEGDHYFYFDEQIDLLRALDEFVVSIDAEANIEDVIASLTGSGGALEAYDHRTTLDAQRVVLTRPDEVTFVSIDLNDVESVAGVAWAAPVFVGEDSGNLAIVTDEITLELKPGVDPEEFFATGFVSWQPFIGNQYIAVVEDGGLFALDTANSLSANENVEWAQPNMYVDVIELTNDPLFGNQWTLNNTSQFGAKNDADGDVVEAWNTTTGSADVVVAVLDSGVQLNHPDLSAHIFTNTGEVAGNGIDDDANGFIDDVHGWDFFGVDTDGLPDNDPNPFPTASGDAHGTAVAGVIAAVGENMVGVTGVSQNSTILPVRISGSTGFATNATLTRAVYYAAGAVLNAGGQIVGTWRGADVINCSWGGGAQDAGLTGAFNWAATQARDGEGIPVFVATGNSAAGRQGSATEQYNGIARTATGLFSAFGNSTWSWVLSYRKDASVTAGEDTVRLGRFVNDNGTNTRWDSATVVPTGWSMTPFVGQDGWFIEDNPARAHGTGRYQARSTAIGNSDEAFILAPPINITSANPDLTGTLYTWQSAAVADTMNLYLFNYGTGQLFTLSANAGTFAGVVPTLVQGTDVDVAYPGNLANVIGVGATTDWDYRSHFSQYGTALDLVAPSNGGFASVSTTDLTGAGGYSGNDYTSTFGGTSAAAPYAAGIAALLLSRNPDLRANDIRSIMQNTAEKVGGNVGATAYTTGFNQFYGFGRVNASTAVEAVPGASGDYNRDGSVNAADYTVWRDNLGDTGLALYAGADGNGNGMIDSGDYAVWKAHFGQTITPTPGSGSIAPESALADTSQDFQDIAATPAVVEILMTEITTIASTDFTVVDLGLLPATLAPIGRATVQSASIFQGRSALADISIRQDEGLLAWLSARSFQRPSIDVDFGDDSHDFLAEDRDHYRDAADSAIEVLAPFVRTTTKLLVSIS